MSFRHGVGSQSCCGETGCCEGLESCRVAGMLRPAYPCGDSAACVLLIPPFDGGFGDYSLNPCYFDLDLSGEVGANDLLNLLNTYGQEAGCSWSED